MEVTREISDERERKLRVRKKGEIVAEGGGGVATVGRDNISERLSIAAFYAN